MFGSWLHRWKSLYEHLLWSGLQRCFGPYSYVEMMLCVKRKKFILRWLNLAPRARWLWLNQVDNMRPWAEFYTEAPAESLSLFMAASNVAMGTMASALFWKNCWLDRLCTRDLAPFICAHVLSRAKGTRRVRVCDSQTLARPRAKIYQQFMPLSSRFEHVVLIEWAKNGILSARFAQAAFFCRESRGWRETSNRLASRGLPH
jgi:hypothetical protein